MKKYFVKLSVAIVLTSTLFTGCGEDKKTTVIKEITQEPVVAQTEEPHGYELDEYSFHGKTSLEENLYVSAKEVYFRLGSEVKINDFNLKVEALTVIFERESHLISFYPREYNACRLPGKNSGSIEINAEEILGSPFIDLAGQNAGQIGMYSIDNAGSVPISLDHKELAGRWYDGCSVHQLGKRPIDIPELLEPRVGGEEGELLIKASDYNEFSPVISERTSHSSYTSRIEGRYKRLSWWEVVKRGPNGQPGRVCLYVGTEYLCK